VQGSIFNITYVFMHGSKYFQTTIGETYNVFTGTNLTTNPWSAYASSEATTGPCNAINHAIDILSTTTIDYRSRRRLFYWGFSTPNLTNCVTSGRSFKDISTYAIRQTLAADLNAIESTYGNFTECDWYQATSDSDPLPSEAIQNRAVIGTLSDFICAIEETAAPSRPPSLAPTTPAPTIIEVLPVTVTPPPTVKPTSKPTSKPTPNPTNHPSTSTTTSTSKPTRQSNSWWSSVPIPTPKPTTKPTPKPTTLSRNWWSF